MSNLWQQMLSMDTLSNAFMGVETAFYLLHSMEGFKKEWEQFADREKLRQIFSRQLNNQSKKNNLSWRIGKREFRIIKTYERSRQEVGQNSASGTISVTELRASVIVGAEGGSYAMLRYLVERLPLMVCPRWVKSTTQPIAVENVVDYLVGAMKNPSTSGKIFEIGGPDKMIRAIDEIVFINN